MPDDFRCSRASLADAEAMVGSAPTDRAFLFVEYAGAWGRDAPALVSEHIDVPAGVRVLLIRRHRNGGTPGATVFAAWADGDPSRGAAPFAVERTTLDSLTDLHTLDLAALAEGRSPGLTPHQEPLWLVCTNGRRDLCCAEVGRPVTAALAEEWPEETWETTHLGGHRFAGTLLALPGGHCLGRLDPASAVAACQALARGEVPLDATRGRAGLSGAAQVAEQYVRTKTGLLGLTDVVVTSEEPTDVDGAPADLVVVRAGGRDWQVVVRTTTGAPRRQSCADLKTKPAAEYDVLASDPA